MCIYEFFEDLHILLALNAYLCGEVPVSILLLFDQLAHFSVFLPLLVVSPRLLLVQVFGIFRGGSEQGHVLPQLFDLLLLERDLVLDIAQFEPVRVGRVVSIAHATFINIVLLIGSGVMVDQTLDFLKLLTLSIEHSIRIHKLLIDLFDLLRAFFHQISHTPLLIDVDTQILAPDLVPSRSISWACSLFCRVHTLKLLNLLLRGQGQVLKLRQNRLIAHCNLLNQSSLLCIVDLIIVAGRLFTFCVSRFLQVVVHIIELLSRLAHERLILTQHLLLDLKDANVAAIFHAYLLSI